jgi:hypothetical protein
MIVVSLNLGGRGPVNKFPIIFDFENIREWTDLIRKEESMFAFLDWAESCSIHPLSSMNLWIRVDENDLYWEFEIKLKNIREFKKYLSMDYEEIIPIVESFRREQKINDVLEC